MNDYEESWGTRVDYNRTTGELDPGNRRYNRERGYVNPAWADREEYEPEHYDEDCW